MYKKTKQNETKRNKTKQNKTKQNKTKQNKTKQNKTKQNKTKQNKNKQTKKTNKQPISSLSYRFILTVHDLIKTNFLDSIVHRYLTSLSGLARSAAPEVIHIPHLLHIKSIYQLYLERHVGAHLSSRSKVDPTDNPALDSRIKREGKWSKSRSCLFVHTVKIRSTGLIIISHLRKRKRCWPDPLQMRLLRAG